MHKYATAALAVAAGTIGASLLALAWFARLVAHVILVLRVLLLGLGAAAVTISICTAGIFVWQSLTAEDAEDVNAEFGDEGWQRVSVFIRKVLPIVFHYKWVEIKTKGKSAEEVSAAFQPLHNSYAKRALAICQQMQGFYIKLGQMSAGAGTGVLPQEFLDEFTVLFEDCPPSPGYIIKQIVERDLGPIADIFEEFDEWPLHTASIGQVHCARLVGGADVVVKVQNPNSERRFRIDIECFLQVARLLFREHLHELEAIKKSFSTEFDYEKEAALQREAVSHLASFSSVVVPVPIDEFHQCANLGVQKGKSRRSGLCTKCVLTMERLYGKSLACWGNEVAERMAASKGITKEEVISNLQKMGPEELEQQKPSQLGMWMVSTGFRTGEVVCATASTAYTITAPLRDGLSSWGIHAVTMSMFEWFAQSLPTWPSNALPSFDVYSLPDVLFQIQGHLLFEAGFVNADPHPGNIMFLDDGRLGLIDWGQVTRLTTDQRCHLARAVISVADGDDVLAAAAMRSMGMRTVKDLDWTYSRQAHFFLASWTDERVQEIGGPMKMEDVLNKVDRILVGVGDFWMPMRNQFFTRQALAMLGFPRVNSSVLLRPAAVQFLEGIRRPIPKTVPRRAQTPPGLSNIIGRHAKKE